MEAFVASMLEIHELTDPFDLLKQEYDEAARSIRDHRSIYWKEKLSILSAAMNYPAKHFSAEDRLRLTRVLMPLISVVIASFTEFFFAYRTLKTHGLVFLKVVQLAFHGLGTVSADSCELIALL